MTAPFSKALGRILLGLALFAAAPAAAQTEPPAARQGARESGKIDLEVDLDPVAVEAGALVYAEKCSLCHGLDLAGSTRAVKERARPEIVVPPLGLTTDAWRYPEPMLRSLVRFGELVVVQHRSPATMPAHRDILKPAEIDSVLAFIKANWTPEMRARQAAITARAEETERRFDQGMPLLPDREGSSRGVP